ncbi:MAG: glycoside hydrolase family 3 protein [Nitrospinae bacterium]|nr:glycoside hydrolase family 3 protein [Nitrospinota bacterium]
MAKKSVKVPVNLGQMLIVSFPGFSWNPVLEEVVCKRKAGGVIFFKENVPPSLAELKKFNAKIKKEGLRASGIIPFITVDEEGGRVSRLRHLIGEHPPAMEVGAKGPAEVRKNYLSLGRKVRSAGFNLTWAPVLDVHTNAQNPVIGNRAFSSDPAVTAECGASAIKGLRSAGLFTCGKHFPGHGDTFADSHLELPEVETEIGVLRERELVPFKRAVAEKADFFMSAHVLYKKVDAKNCATFSKKILTNLLRREMGFKGLVVTDDLNMKAVGGTMRERIKRALNAGADVLLVRDENPVAFMDTFEALIRDGGVDLGRIRESLRRIRRIKTRLKS